MNDVRIVLSTVDDDQKARQLAHRLVEDRLAACVNIIPNLISVYKWKGETQEEKENLLVIKTLDSHLQALIADLAEMHPYDVPEVVALPVEDGHQPYLDWVKGCVGE